MTTNFTLRFLADDPSPDSMMTSFEWVYVNADVSSH